MRVLFFQHSESKGVIFVSENRLDSKSEVLGLPPKILKFSENLDFGRLAFYGLAGGSLATGVARFFLKSELYLWKPLSFFRQDFVVFSAEKYFKIKTVDAKLIISQI